MALYCHYDKQLIQLGGPVHIEIIKFKFTGGLASTDKMSKYDYERMKEINSVIKQIPSAQRSYDPLTNVWTIPFNKLDTLFVLVSLVGQMITHADFNLWLNPPSDDSVFGNRSKPAWHQQVMGSGRVKVEAAEDFFKNNISNSAVVMSIQELEMQLRTIILGVMPSLTLQNKEEFLRGYKLAARKLHPDMNNGDGSRMSELNSLWSQYREVAK